MTDHAHALICGPQPSLSIGGKMKSLTTLLIVGVLMTCSWKFGPEIRKQVKTLYWQRACTNFALEDDWVAYEEDAIAAGELAKVTGADRKNSWNDSEYFTITDGASSKLLGCYLVPRCATELQSLIGGGAPSGPVVFLHSRRAKNGASRLVQVELSLIGRTLRKDADAKNVADDQVLKIQVIKPAGLFSDAQLQKTSGWWHRGLSETPFGKLRVFAGQPDLADDSHFTIVYHDELAHGTLDCWLQADDSVRVEMRDPLKLQ